MSAMLLTPERITLAGLVLSFLGKVVADWFRARRAEAEREARERREEAALQAKAAAWMREKVDEMIEAERTAHSLSIKTMQERIGHLEQALEDERAARREAEERLSVVPELAEDLARALSRIDPSRTPTGAEIDHLRRAGAALGISTSSVNGLVLGKAPT